MKINIIIRKKENACMKNKIKRILIVLLTIFTISSTYVTIFYPEIVTEAHPGRTDSKGGHKDKKNVSGLGSYHYHCGGNPAHLHTGGVCPYANTSTTTNTTTTSEKSAVTINDTTSSALNGTVTDNQTSIVSDECDNLIFSAQYYITRYPDLAIAIGYNSQDLYNHFIQYGIAEGRQGIETFNVQVYRDNNPDLVAAFGDNLMLYCYHYIQTGHNEGRICY
jgi:hypothetical protein